MFPSAAVPQYGSVRFLLYLKRILYYLTLNNNRKQENAGVK